MEPKSKNMSQSMPEVKCRKLHGATNPPKMQDSLPSGIDVIPGWFWTFCPTWICRLSFHMGIVLDDNRRPASITGRSQDDSTKLRSQSCNSFLEFTLWKAFGVDEVLAVCPAVDIPVGGCLQVGLAHSEGRKLDPAD